MGESVVKNRMELDGDNLVIGGTLTVADGGTVAVDNGATVTGLTGQTTFASSAEVIAGSVNNKVIAPDTLATLTSTSSRKGLVELATNAESLAGSDSARAVTPDDLAHVLGKIDIISFTGAAAPGACTATGLKVNDVILSVTGVASGTKGDQSAKFEAAVSVADQIQQSDGGNLSSNVYMALVLRKS